MAKRKNTKSVSRFKQSVKKPAKETVKVLVWGATPYVITGFGSVMKEILQNLFRSHPGDYEIFQLGINHHGDFYDEFWVTGGLQNGRYKQWPATSVVGGRTHLYGQPKFLDLLRSIDVDLDCIFMCEDPFWIGGDVPDSNPPVSFIDAVKGILQAKGLAHVPVICYFPIDGKPKVRWINNIAKYDIPITYLNFGAQECLQANPDLRDRLVVIPHGVNTKEFFPITESEIRRFKRVYFGDQFVNKFMVLNVNRNQMRKLVPSTLIAFKEFQKSVPESFIYLHMKPVDVGWNLLEVINTLGLKLGKDVVMPKDFQVPKGLPVEDLNRIFNAADLLVSTATGGGWELSISQAFATKTCVLMPANTSHVDLCGPQDNPQECRGMLYNSGSRFSQVLVFPSDNEVPRPLPDLDDMIAKMKYLYDNPEVRRGLEQNAYDWALNTITWEKHIVPNFDKVFKSAKTLKKERLARNEAKAATNNEDKITVDTNVYFGTLKLQ